MCSWTLIGRYCVPLLFLSLSFFSLPSSVFLLLFFTRIHLSSSTLPSSSLLHLLKSLPPPSFYAVFPPPPPSSSTPFFYLLLFTSLLLLSHPFLFFFSCTLIVLPALLCKPITIGCLARGWMLIGSFECRRRAIGICCCSFDWLAGSSDDFLSGHTVSSSVT